MWRFAPVSWLSEADAVASFDRGGPSRSVSSSDQPHFTRLQLRGSAGFSPASHSPKHEFGETRTEVGKEQNAC